MALFKGYKQQRKKKRLVFSGQAYLNINGQSIIIVK